MRWCVLGLFVVAGCHVVAGYDDYSFGGSPTLAVGGGGQGAMGGGAATSTTGGGGSAGGGGLGGSGGTELPPIGDLAWSFRFGGTGTDDIRDIAVRPNGHVVLVGTTSSSIDFGGATNTVTGGAGTTMFVAELDAEGSGVWARGFGTSGANDNEDPRAIAVAPNGDTYVVGTLSDGVDFGGFPVPSGASGTNGFILALDDQGEVRWAEAIGGSGGSDTTSQTAEVVAASDTEVAVAGRNFGSMNLGGQLYDASSGGYVLTFSRTGVILEATPVGDGTTATRVTGLGFRGTDLAVTGAFTGSLSFGGNDAVSAGGPEPFVALLGVALQGDAMTLGPDITVGALGTSPAGPIALGGHLEAARDLGTGPLMHAGSLDGLMAILSPSLNVVSARRFGDEGPQRVDAIEITDAGELFVGGSFSGEITELGTPPLTAPGMDGRVFVAVVTASGIVRMRVQSTGDDIHQLGGIGRGGGLLVAAFDTFGDAAFGGDTFTNIDGKGDIFISAFTDE